jgi:hypothetical protein
MPAQSATLAVLSRTAAVTADDLHVDAAECSRLLELLSLVPDPRERHGVVRGCGSDLPVSYVIVVLRVLQKIHVCTLTILTVRNQNRDQLEGLCARAGSRAGGIV